MIFYRTPKTEKRKRNEKREKRCKKMKKALLFFYYLSTYIPHFPRVPRQEQELLAMNRCIFPLFFERRSVFLPSIFFFLNANVSNSGSWL